ncbi:adhesin [Salimicrobium sp. PL1-032A]|uniref:adhesin n=1 Tax=Salimicrobium sp. PL1-032A TaxID=3095364 RepID=UPI003260B069
MNISESAKETLQAMIKENGADGVRVEAAGQGCCGPQVGLSLEGAQENDEIQWISDIQVAIDPQVKDTVENITLDKEDDQFVLLGLESCQ